MSSNILTYSIAREWLQGSIGNQTFSMHAWSGGRRGSTTPGASQHGDGSYNVFRKEQNASMKGPFHREFIFVAMSLMVRAVKVSAWIRP